MVESLLTLQYEQEDRVLERLAYQFVGVMYSSGNYRKSTQVSDLVNSIYSPLILSTEEATESSKPVRNENITQEDAAAIIAKIEAKLNK